DLVTGVQTCALPIYTARSTSRISRSRRGISGPGSSIAPLSSSPRASPRTTPGVLLHMESYAASAFVRSYGPYPRLQLPAADDSRSEERRVGKDCRIA